MSLRVVALYQHVIDFRLWRLIHEASKFVYTSDAGLGHIKSGA